MKNRQLKSVFAAMLCVLAFGVNAQAATLYWWKTGANANWATVTGNWWTISGNPAPSGVPATWIAGKTLVQASAIPASGDSIYLIADGTHAAPATGPAADLSMPIFDTTCCLKTLTTTVLNAHLICSANAILNLGVPGDLTDIEHQFSGSTGLNATITTHGAGQIRGTVNGDWTSYDASSNQSAGTVNGDWYSYDQSYNSGTVNGDHDGYDNSYNGFNAQVTGDEEITISAALTMLNAWYSVTDQGGPASLTFLTGLPDPSNVKSGVSFGPPDATQTGTLSTHIVSTASGKFSN